MRKQILSGLIAAVALLFSVVALTSAPASGQSYSSYPAQSGATISGVITPADGEECPCEVTITFANGVMVSSMTAADGSFTLPIPAGAAGEATVTSNGVEIATFQVNAPPVPTATAVVVNPTAVVVNPTAVVVATAAPATVVPANNFGFNGQGVPTTPALAVTGTDTDVLGFVATGLIALGAVAMGSRRKFLQGALED